MLVTAFLFPYQSAIFELKSSSVVQLNVSYTKSFQDMKSANVLLDAYLRAKLADLGLAKVCYNTEKPSLGELLSEKIA